MSVQILSWLNELGCIQVWGPQFDPIETFLGPFEEQSRLRLLDGEGGAAGALDEVEAGGQGPVPAEGKEKGRST